MKRVRVIDSHTGGEPTRVVLEGGPDLGRGPLAERRALFQREHDAFRRAVVNEPRGSDVLVGALLVEPADPSCCTGVIFFDNVTFIGMCGHGTIGVVTTLAHLGRLGPGTHRLETPVGVVEARLEESGDVVLTNVPAYRKAANVALALPDGSRVTGDVAWGGNWFFLTEAHGQELSLTRVEALTACAWQLRLAANAQGFPEVDHVVLLAPGAVGAEVRNFVLCPGKAYDRSPCGTGTSALLACRAAEGRLAEDQPLVVESVVGSRFTGRYRWVDDSRRAITPLITGRAFITAESTLLLDERDPFCWGISP